MKKISTLILLFGFTFPVFAQEKPHLHTSSEWEECSFQLDPSLTQADWHQFSKEAALVAYFRPLTGAEPMGRGKFDISIMQWKTKIDESDAAWNNTFVHPDTTHWLIDGPRLPIPGLAARAGLTNKLDLGIYWTTNPLANYSVAGAQLQYNFLPTTSKGLTASTRLTYSMIYGPRDITFATTGVDLVASKKFNLYSDWIALTPYANASLMFSRAHERTSAVELKDENVFNTQGAIGAVAQLSVLRLAVEYNQGITNTISYRIGVAFGINKLKGEKL